MFCCDDQGDEDAPQAGDTHGVEKVYYAARADTEFDGAPVGSATATVTATAKVRSTNWHACTRLSH